MKQMLAVVCVLAAVALVAEAKPPSKLNDLIRELKDYIEAEEGQIQQRFVYRLEGANSTAMTIRLGRSTAQNAILNTCTFLVKYRPVGEELWTCYPKFCIVEGWNSNAFKDGVFTLVDLTSDQAYEVKDEMFCGGVEQAQSATRTYSTTA